MAYADITANGTITPSARQGRLERVVIGNPGTAWVLTIYDNTAGSGSIIATLTVTAIGYYDFGDDCDFSNGLTVVASGTTAGNATVIFN